MNGVRWMAILLSTGKWIHGVSWNELISAGPSKRHSHFVLAMIRMPLPKGEMPLFCCWPFSGYVHKGRSKYEIEVVWGWSIELINWYIADQIDCTSPPPPKKSIFFDCKYTFLLLGFFKNRYLINFSLCYLFPVSFPLSWISIMLHCNSRWGFMLKWCPLVLSDLNTPFSRSFKNQYTNIVRLLLSLS